MKIMLLGWFFCFGLGWVEWCFLGAATESMKKMLIHVNGLGTKRYKKSLKYCQCLIKDLTINPKKSMTVFQLLLTDIN